MATLHLHESDAAMEVAIDRALGRALGRALATGANTAALEVGRGWTSVPRLLREAASEAPLRPLAEALIVREAARAAGMPALAERLRPIWMALRAAGVTAAALREVAPRLLGRLGVEAQRLAEGLGRYERLLDGRRDAGASAREALQVLARGASPMLREVDEVIAHFTPLAPLEAAVIDALARGRVVRCEAPSLHADGGAPVYRDALREAASVALAHLEAVSTHGVEAAARELGEGPVPAIFAAATPALEARHIARLVRDRVAAGAAPDDVLIVADDPARRVEIARALASYGVVVDAEPARALDAAAARIALGLIELADDPQPRDRLADLLGSRYLAGGVHTGERWVSGRRIARLVRQAVPAGADRAAVEESLGRIARSPGAAPDVAPLAGRALALLAAVARLPAAAPLIRHATALRRLYEEVELFARARGFRRSAPPAPGSAAATAIARDQAALGVVSDLLEELPRAAGQAGLRDRSWPRAEVLALLRGVLATTALPAGGGRGAAVRLRPSAGLAALDAPILVLAGAEEGGLPMRAEEDPLLGDETRRALGRAMGRALLPTAAAAEARAELAIAAACAAADEVTLTWSRVDARGGARLSGPLVEDARARGALEVRGELAPIPSLQSVREPGELLACYGRALHGSAAHGWSDEARARVRAALTVADAERLHRVERLGELERSRASFFAGDREAGAHDGRLADAGVLAALQARLPGSARPLSATTLQHYVECPQRFFLEHVLRVRLTEAQGDDLDPRASGTLSHRAIERLFRAWQAAGLLPLRGRDEEGARIAEVVDAVAAEWEAPRGHALVWRANLRALHALLEALWRREVVAPPAPGLSPADFELSFDGLHIEGDPGEAPVLLGGRIDRVDLGRDDAGALRAAVFDYKSGKIERFKRELKEEAFAETSWQLPLYAAAVRARLGAGEVRMHYYGLRDLEDRHAGAPGWLRVDRGTEPSSPTLGDRIVSHVRAMRGGRFDTAPQPDACARCGLQAACRIVERRDEGEEGAP